MIFAKSRRSLLALCLGVMVLVGCEQAEQPASSTDILRQDPQSRQFTAVVPGKEWKFPQDHLSHPSYRTEWWYLTANLESSEGETFGVQWTLFRYANDRGQGTGWNSPQMYMAHTVVTSKEKNRHAERFARGGIGQAGVASNPYRVWLDNWVWSSFGDSPFPGRLLFADDAMLGDLRIRNQGELVFQGENGYSRKHATADIASYYYSAPFLHLDGILQLDGKVYKVKGDGWYDREWSSEGLTDKQQGWDWFSVHLDDGSALMVYQIREKDAKPYYFGSLSWPDGRTIQLKQEDITMTPVSYMTVSGKELPLKWRIDIPSHQIELEVDVVRKEQWLPFVFSYWEGPIKVTGSHLGQGFMELTGY